MPLALKTTESPPQTHSHNQYAPINNQKREQGAPKRRPPNGARRIFF